MRPTQYCRNGDTLVQRLLHLLIEQKLARGKLAKKYAIRSRSLMIILSKVEGKIREKIIIAQAPPQSLVTQALIVGIQVPRKYRQETFSLSIQFSKHAHYTTAPTVSTYSQFIVWGTAWSLLLGLAATSMDFLAGLFSSLCYPRSFSGSGEPQIAHSTKRSWRR